MARRRPDTADDDVVAVLRAAGCVYADEEARLLRQTGAAPRALARLVARRATGEPLEHVLGWAEFCGLRVAVGPGVFVPRRRTELLVREAVRVLRRAGADVPARDSEPWAGSPVVVDLCCGSGAVGLAIATAAGPLELVAADADPLAVACAARNLAAVDGRAMSGDLFSPLPDHLRGRVDVLVANAPYVPTAAIALLPPEARVHEPPLALDGGDDGLAVLRRVVAGAGPWLAAGGHLVVETGAAQAATLAVQVAAQGLASRVVRAEDLDATAVVGSPLPVP